MIPLIEPHARVCALDLEGTESIDDEADLAAELIPGPAMLVGHSRGGLVATAIAERHPSLARKLLLFCTPWPRESRVSARRPVERALAVPGLGRLVWAAATDAQQRRAAATAFAPDTPVPERFADLRTTGRQRLVASSRAIDTYLAEAPLAQRLTASRVPAELIFGQLDARITPPPSNTLSPRHVMLLTGVGDTPPWEAPDRTAQLITSSLTNDGDGCT